MLRSLGVTGMAARQLVTEVVLVAVLRVVVPRQQQGVEPLLHGSPIFIEDAGAEQTNDDGYLN